MHERFGVPFIFFWTMVMTSSGHFFTANLQIFAEDHSPVAAASDNGKSGGENSPFEEDASTLTLYGTTWTVNRNVRQGQFEGEYTPPNATPKRIAPDPGSPFLPLPEEYEAVPNTAGFFRSTDGKVYWFKSDKNGHFILKDLPEGDYEVVTEQNRLRLWGKKNVTVYYTGGKTGLMIYLGPVSHESR